MQNLGGQIKNIMVFSEVAYCISLVRVILLQVCRFSRLILLGEWKNFIYDPTSRVSIYSIRRMENIMLDLIYCALDPKIASH